MNEISIQKNGTFFRNSLTFSNKEGVYSLKEVIRKRLSKMLVVKDDFIKSFTISPQIKKRYVINNFIKYINTQYNSKVTFIFLNFEQIKIIDEGCETIFSYNILEQIKSRKLQNLVKSLKLDKELILSTLLSRPLIPNIYEESIINISILDHILYPLIKKIQNISTSNIVITGEMIWSNWVDAFGLVYLLKNYFNNIDYSVYIDKMALWDVLFEKRKKEKFLYKIYGETFYPDVLLFNTINTTKVNKFQLFEINKFLYLDKTSYINLFKDVKSENTILFIPKYILINNKSNIELKDITKEIYQKYQLNFVQIKNKNELGKINLIRDVSLKIKMFKNEKSLIPNSSLFYQNQKIGEGYWKEKLLIEYEINKSEVNCIDGQLVKKNDTIAYRNNLFKKDPIKSPSDGRINLSVLKCGMIILEQEIKNIDIKLPFSGFLQSFTKAEGFNIRVDVIEMPLTMQFGKNCFATDIKEQIPFPKIYFFKHVKNINLTLKNVLDENIKLIMIDYSSFEEVKVYIKKNYEMLEYVSIGLFNSHIKEHDYILGAFINNITEKYFILENGFLKLIVDSKNSKFIKLKEEYQLNTNGKIQRISYKTDYLYGNIIRPLGENSCIIKINSSITEQNNSDLILLKYFNE